MKFMEKMRIGCSDFEKQIWTLMLDKDELTYIDFLKARKHEDSWNEFLGKHEIPEDKIYFPIMSFKKDKTKPYFSISTICIFTGWHKSVTFEYDAKILYQCLTGKKLDDYPGFKNAFANRYFLGFREHNRQHIEINTREYCETVFHADITRIPLLTLGLLTIPS